MKKLLMMLLCCVLVVGCGNENGAELTSKDSTVATGKTSEEKEESAKEYSYTDLKELNEIFVDAWLEETGKLSEVEYWGMSDDENEKNEHYFKMAADYAKKVAGDHEEVPAGKRVIVTGYIESIVELDENGFFVTKGCGKIMFYLKHNAEDDDMYGFSCATDDESFLGLQDNTAVKIEGTFVDPDMFGSNNDLYDCKIIEIGKQDEGKGESMDTEKTEMQEENISDAYKKGEEFGDEISKELESIDWEENYEKAEESGKEAAEWLNGLIGGE